MEQIDYLVIGHITCDLALNESRVGGTVSYAGQIAHALGCQTAVLTSCAAEYGGLQALGDLQVHVVAAAATTTFENVYTPDGRIQTIHAVADAISVEDLPADWNRPAVVHLAPVANELAPALIHQFPRSIIGLTPQGWMRRWDKDGRVLAREWPDAEMILPLADVVILSKEDLLHDDMLAQYRRLARLLILTENARGCTVFWDDEARQFPAPQVREVDPTGAGDIFAAAFLVYFLQATKNPWEAAQFANKVAAHSITQTGLAAKLELIRSQQFLP